VYPNINPAPPVSGRSDLDLFVNEVVPVNFEI